MIYEKLELKGYKRLHLTKIDEITIEPLNKTQLILGTNGSGKSTLLKEFSPFPIIPSEFEKNGYKRVKITHRGSVYELTSTNLTTVKNTFVKDGVELNDGQTSAVQKELVRIHFNLTQEVFDLIMGYTTITKMPPSTRLKWFTTLSKVDYTYALKKYADAKELLKEVTVLYNASLRDHSKVVDTSLTTDTIKETESHIQALKTAANHLNGLRNNIVNGYSKNELEELNNESVKILKLVKVAKDEIGDNITHDKAATEKEYYEAETSSRLLTARRAELLTQQVQLQTKVDIANSVSVDVKTLKKTSTLVNELKDYLARLTHDYSGINKIVYEEQAPATLELMQQLLVEYKDNSEKLINKTTHAANLTKLSELEAQLLSLKIKLTQHNTQLEQLEKAAEHVITCPKCEHKWADGYNETTHNRLILNTDDVITHIAETEKSITKLKDAIELYNEHAEVFRNLLTLKERLAVLYPAINRLMSDEDLFFYRHRIVSIVRTLLRDTPILSQVNKLDADIKEQEQLLSLQNIKQEANTNNYKQQVEDINLTVTTLTEQINVTNNVANTCKLRLKNLDRITQLENRLLEITNRLGNITSTEITQIKNEYITEMTYAIGMRVTTLERKLLDAQMVEKNTKRLEQQIIDYKQQMDVAKALVASLSPTDGLIGKSLVSFINHIIASVNKVIENIWTYSFVISPIAMEDDDLDYKLPFTVNGGEPIPDISKASAAMEEVINLGFKITAMQYLGMLDYPIYFDEFGHKMDDMHRRQAFEVINTLSMNDTFSQLFVISHFADCYSALSNTDTTIISKDNLMLDISNYNTRTKIKYKGVAA